MTKKRKISSEKISKKIIDDQAKSAQISILEEIFYDVYPNRWKIYQVNFLRGLFFGFGSVIGATVLVIITVMILNLFVNIPGGIGDFIKDIVDSMNKSI